MGRNESSKFSQAVKLCSGVPCGTPEDSTTTVQLWGEQEEAVYKDSHKCPSLQPRVHGTRTCTFLLLILLESGAWEWRGQTWYLKFHFSTAYFCCLEYRHCQCSKWSCKFYRGASLIADDHEVTECGLSNSSIHVVAQVSRSILPFPQTYPQIP